MKFVGIGQYPAPLPIHANSAELGLKRLESLIAEVLMNVPKDLITEAIDVVVSIKRTANGRLVDEILHVAD